MGWTFFDVLIMNLFFTSKKLFCKKYRRYLKDIHQKFCNFILFLDLKGFLKNFICSIFIRLPFSKIWSLQFLLFCIVKNNLGNNFHFQVVAMFWVFEFTLKKWSNPSLRKKLNSTLKIVCTHNNKPMFAEILSKFMYSERSCFACKRRISISIGSNRIQNVSNWNYFKKKERQTFRNTKFL